MSRHFYIGWDVGAWNCDKNPKSRDAIVILDNNGRLIGTPWRGNLRETINKSKSTEDFISALLSFCELGNTENKSITMAIDAPLGFSDGLINLLNGSISNENFESHTSNHYLFRQTERLLFKEGFKPLSSIKDMIGSQTTKAMHVINKFTPNIQSCGVWTDITGMLKIIETYPSACREMELNNTLDENVNQDIKDALVCAEIAYLFVNKRSILVSPASDIPKKEGWIWYLINTGVKQELLTGKTRLV